MIQRFFFSVTIGWRSTWHSGIPTIPIISPKSQTARLPLHANPCLYIFLSRRCIHQAIFSLPHFLPRLVSRHLYRPFPTMLIPLFTKNSHSRPEPFSYRKYPSTCHPIRVALKVESLQAFRRFTPIKANCLNPLDLSRLHDQHTAPIKCRRCEQNSGLVCRAAI